MYRDFSRRGFSRVDLGSVLKPLVCLGLWFSLEFPCLVTSHDFSTVSLSGIAKCLFCVETLAFLAESRPPGQFAGCLLIYCKTVVLEVVVLCLDNCTLAMSQSQTF